MLIEREFASPFEVLLDHHFKIQKKIGHFVAAFDDRKGMGNGLKSGHAVTQMLPSQKIFGRGKPAQGHAGDFLQGLLAFNHPARLSPGAIGSDQLNGPRIFLL